MGQVLPRRRDSPPFAGQSQVDRAEGNERKESDNGRRGSPLAPGAGGRGFQDREPQARQPKAHQMAEVAHDRQYGEAGGASPGPSFVTSAPPDAERQGEQARPEHETGKAKQPGDVQGEDGRKDRRM